METDSANLGPFVQSIINLTSSLKSQLVMCFTPFIYIIKQIIDIFC